MCVCVQRLWLYMKTAPKLSQTRCHAAAPIRLPVIRKLGIMEVVQPDRSSSRLRKMATGSQFVREKGPNRKSKWAGVQVAAAAPTHEAKQAPVFLTFITLMNLVETFQKCRVKHDPSFCSPGETSSRCWYFSSDFTPCGFQIITEAVCLFSAKLSYLQRSVYSLSSRLIPSATFFQIWWCLDKITEVDDSTTWLCLYLDGINPCSY